MVGNDLPEVDTACASPAPSASAPASDDSGSDAGGGPPPLKSAEAKERLRREMSRPDVHDVAGDEIDIPRYNTNCGKITKALLHGMRSKNGYACL